MSTVPSILPALTLPLSSLATWMAVCKVASWEMLPADPVGVCVRWQRAQGPSREESVRKANYEIVGHFHGTQKPDGAVSEAFRTDECASFTARKLFTIAHCLVCASAT